MPPPRLVVLLLSPTIAPGTAIRLPLVAVVAGMVVFSAGEAMRVWSKVALGRDVTDTVMTSRDQPVVTSGPYHCLRHPSDAGTPLIAPGIGAVWGNRPGLATMVVGILAGLRHRTHVEEQALPDDLGDRDRTDAERRERLVPFIWRVAVGPPGRRRQPGARLVAGWPPRPVRAGFRVGAPWRRFGAAR